jgi:hypothetical protein
VAPPGNFQSHHWRWRGKIAILGLGMMEIGETREERRTREQVDRIPYAAGLSVVLLGQLHLLRRTFSAFSAQSVQITQ